MKFKGFSVKTLLSALVCVVSLVFLLNWARAEVRSFSRRFAGRPFHFLIRPDADDLFRRARILSANIHIPDFAKLAEALNGREKPEGIMTACANYHRYITDAMPNRYDAFLAQGVCEYYLGRLADAEISLTKALIVKPGSFWTYYDLGMLYFNRGVHHQAVEVLKKAAESARSYNSGDIVTSKVISDVMRADKEKDPALTFKRSYVDLYRAIATSCFVLNDQACVKEYAEAGRQMSGGEEAFFVLLGASSYSTKNYKEALVFLTEAVRRYPESGAAYFFLSMVSKELGDAPSLLRNLQKAKELGFNPDHFLSGIEFPLRLY